MVDRALEMEGTCTVSVHRLPLTLHSDKIQGEHGIGIGKKASLVKELGLDTIGVMQKVQQALDPHGIMNPGKIFDPPASA